MKTILAIILLLTSGCALLPQNTKDQAVNLAGKVCLGLSPQEREILRSEVNAQLAPKGMAWCGLKCPGEAAPVVPACKPAP